MRLGRTANPVCLRQSVSALCAILLGISLAACSPIASEPVASAISPSATIYTANKVITMHDAQPEAQAVAVSGPRIVAVGTEQSIRQSLNDYTLTVDRRFAGKVIMPGFIDNHLHPALAGILLPSEFITPFDWQLPGRSYQGVQGRQAYLQALAELVGTKGDTAAPLISWGYHQYFHGELNRSDLDRIAPAQPLIVWQRSFHELFANTAALQLLGVDEQALAEQPGVDIAKGHFWETGLFAIFPRLAPYVLHPARFKSGIADGLRHAQMNGVTTVCDQGVPLMDLDSELASLDAVLVEQAIPLRTLLIGNSLSLSRQGGHEQALEIIRQLPARNTERVQYLPGQVKLLADGAFYSQLMQMEQAYLDGHHGEWLMSPTELESAMRLYWQENYQLHIHVNGDKGLNVLLGILQKLQQERYRADHRTVFHHYGYSGEEHAQRLAELGVSVSANPFYLWALGDKYSEIGLGPERAHYITRLGDLERHSVPVSFHSDLPMAPAAPLTLAAVAASRKTAAGNVLAPEEKMSVHAALRGITIEAAAAIRQEDRIGSIEAGKLADFTVLEQDPYAVTPDALAGIEVWGTVLGGQVHRRPQFAGQRAD